MKIIAGMLYHILVRNEAFVVLTKCMKYLYLYFIDLRYGLKNEVKNEVKPAKMKCPETVSPHLAKVGQ